MKQFLLFLILLCFSPAGVSFASVMEGGVSKTGAGAQNRIIDNQTSMPVPNARVFLCLNKIIRLKQMLTVFSI